MMDGEQHNYPRWPYNNENKRRQVGSILQVDVLAPICAVMVNGVTFYWIVTARFSLTYGFITRE